VELRIAADLFERAQLERIACTNMIRRPEDGGNIDPLFLDAYIDQLTNLEKFARKNMVAVYKRVVPVELRTWQETSRGVGDSNIARLLGHLGDPYTATPHYWQGTGTNRTLMIEPDRPRTISQLWQYSGVGQPGRKTKGMTAEQLAHMGSPTIKMILHVTAECVMKARRKDQDNGPYGNLYDEIKTATEGKVHTVECVRCAKKGTPAQPGTPWNDGHRHAHALRMIGKAMLRDMWLLRRDALS
jgi:hypothetical protein